MNVSQHIILGEYAKRRERERREKRGRLVRAVREGFVTAWRDFWALVRNPWFWCASLVLFAMMDGRIA